MIRAPRLIALLALGLSGVLHLSGLSFLHSDQTIETQGGAQIAVARLGNSFQDVAQGVQQPQPPESKVTVESTEMIQRARVPKTALNPEEPELRAEPREVLASVQRPVPTSMHPRQSAPVPQRFAPLAPSGAMPLQPDTLVPAVPARIAPSAAAQSAPAQSAQTVSQTIKPVPLAPVEPAAQQPDKPAVTAIMRAEVEPTRAIAPPTLTAEAEIDDEEPTRPRVLARPRARPREIAKPAPKPPKPTPAPAKAKPNPGAAQPAQVRGSAEGQKQASQTETTRSSARAAAQAGNVAVSNYPGQVMRKISRLRRPRVRSRGTATVAFRIAPGGGLASIRIAKSSGSAELDAAALQLVRRAAPFPKPPAGARRSFSIGIKGR